MVLLLLVVVHLSLGHILVFVAVVFCLSLLVLVGFVSVVIVAGRHLLFLYCYLWSSLLLEFILHASVMALSTQYHHLDQHHIHLHLHSLLSMMRRMNVWQYSVGSHHCDDHCIVVNLACCCYAHHHYSQNYCHRYQYDKHMIPCYCRRCCYHFMVVWPTLVDQHPYYSQCYRYYVELVLLANSRKKQKTGNPMNLDENHPPLPHPPEEQK